VKAAGVNAIQTYVAWQVHERVEGQYDFEGDNDLVTFTQLAGSLGLLVIIRAGPFIAAERDMGGFPPWLLKNYTANYMPRFRTLNNTAYINAVDRWMGVLLPKIKPLVYSNGGPVITVQVENEYGSLEQCDLQYLNHVKNLFVKYLGNDVVLFTNNGCQNRMFRCGTLPGVLSTLDFGGGLKVAKRCFKAQSSFQPSGPLVISEYYSGWIDNWGMPFQHVDAKTIAKNLDDLLSYNFSVNVNIYMLHGGTNFGFMNGANLYKGYKPQITSYDYDAPISEAGDLTPKYFIIREVILKHRDVPLPWVPIPQIPKQVFGNIYMTRVAYLLDVLHYLSPSGPIKTIFPKTMESVGQNYGFLLYRTEIPSKFANQLVKLEVQGLRDRGIVLVGQLRKATLSRAGSNSTAFTLRDNLTLDILVENQGHITGGSDMQDPKGILGNVTINSEILIHWEMYPLNLDSPDEWREALHSHSTGVPPSFFSDVPTFYSGTVYAAESEGVPGDTFLKFQNWHKGQVYINGFNLGRYWPVAGPEETLYVPGSLMSNAPHPTEVLLLELDGAPCWVPEICFVQSVATPILNGSVHADPYSHV